MSLPSPQPAGWLVEVAASEIQLEVVGDSQSRFGFAEDEDAVGSHALPESLKQFGLGRRLEIDQHVAQEDDVQRRDEMQERVQQVVAAELDAAA